MHRPLTDFSIFLLEMLPRNWVSKISLVLLRYRVAQLKWYQLTFLLVSFECPDVI